MMMSIELVASSTGGAGERSACSSSDQLGPDPKAGGAHEGRWSSNARLSTEACETEQSRASDRRARAEVPRPSSAAPRPRSGSMRQKKMRGVRNGTLSKLFTRAAQTNTRTPETRPVPPSATHPPQGSWLRTPKLSSQAQRPSQLPSIYYLVRKQGPRPRPTPSLDPPCRHATFLLKKAISPSCFFSGLAAATAAGASPSG